MSILDQHAEMHMGGHYDESTSDYKVQGIFKISLMSPLCSSGNLLRRWGKKVKVKKKKKKKAKQKNKKQPETEVGKIYLLTYGL